MTTDEKLAAILAAVQTDPGNRGLARDPDDNLFTATAGDFAAACRSIYEQPVPALDLTTGFYIPTAEPPAFETDGPLGCAFLLRAMPVLGYQACVLSPAECSLAIAAALETVKGLAVWQSERVVPGGAFLQTGNPWPGYPGTHDLAIEVVGPAGDGRCYSMRGRDVTDHPRPTHHPREASDPWRVATIGIGDGGNEIGMGRVPHETVVKNIPNGHLIHCRVPTDHLIVAGVSNWGAYALAAGLFVLNGIEPPRDLFDPDRERAILAVMVQAGPLVDGVTGKQTATVDGLSWEDYARPLVRIREILEAE